MFSLIFYLALRLRNSLVNVNLFFIRFSFGTSVHKCLRFLPNRPLNLFAVQRNTVGFDDFYGNEIAAFVFIRCKIAHSAVLVAT